MLQIAEIMLVMRSEVGDGGGGYASPKTSPEASINRPKTVYE